MPDPVSRSGPFRSDHTNADEPPFDGSKPLSEAEGAAAICAAPDEYSTDQDNGEWSAGVMHLLSRSSSMTPVGTTTTHPLSSSEADEPAPRSNSNSERTSATPVAAFYARAGFTSEGDSVYAGVAGVKGSEAGGNLEVLSASVQVGAQSEVQVGLARVGMRSELGSWEIRTIEAEIHHGVHNPDGSTGSNTGVAANAIAAEVTLGSGDTTVTLGVSAGVGIEVSTGVRDADADGVDEQCVRLGYGPGVVGACIEPEGVSEAAAALYEDAKSAIARWVD